MRISDWSSDVCSSDLGAELVADAATGLEREAGLVDLVEDAVHRILDGARHRAVDGRGGRLVRLRTGVGGNAAGRNGATTQRPHKALVPVAALVGSGLGFSQRLGDTLVGVVDGDIDRFAGLDRKST